MAIGWTSLSSTNAMVLWPSERIIRAMPTVNIFYKNKTNAYDLEALSTELKRYVAEQLTCGDIKLSPDEVSVRLLNIRGNGMLTPIEAEITAAAFKERVEEQDEICLNIQKFLIDKLGVTDVKVWLILSELGHSWK